MNIAIIGCGLIGRKRALALTKNDILVACCDSNPEIGKKFSSDFPCTQYTDYRKLLKEVNCDVVVVAVVNKFAKDIIINSLKAGKHVITEKPLGRNLEEAEDIVEVWKNRRLGGGKNGILEKWSNGMTKKQMNGIVENWNSGKPNITLSYNSNTPSFQHSSTQILKTGFNHRFHPAVWKAKELIDSGKIGKVFNIRARYGHGGRAGMEKEWRASKDLCGGGELLDQGVHIIDLIRWFGGEISEVYGSVGTKFWDMEVEDNAFVILKSINNVTSSFHVSWTNWKNIFSFEIFGTDGYLKIEGLGGSYGPETLEIGIRKKEGGRPEIEFLEFKSEDISWEMEWNEFKSAISENRQVIGSGYDGLKANEVINAIYISNKKKKVVYLD